MPRIRILTLIAPLFLTCIALVGCGEGPFRCDVPFDSDKRLPLTLTPAAVLAGEETTVLVSFDEPVFSGGDFMVFDMEADIDHPTEPEFIGSFFDSVFRMDRGEPPIVHGVILAGEVIDDRTIELIIKFPADAEPAMLRFVARATNGDVHCYVQVLGETTLEVRTRS